jgi:hypothetical protein
VFLACMISTLMWWIKVEKQCTLFYSDQMLFIERQVCNLATIRKTNTCNQQWTSQNCCNSMLFPNLILMHSAVIYHMNHVLQPISPCFQIFSNRSSFSLHQIIKVKGYNPMIIHLFSKCILWTFVSLTAGIHYCKYKFQTADSLTWHSQKV